MRPPTTAQLSRMQSHAEESMWDTCIIKRYAAVPDPYGHDSPMWFDEDAISCGFDASARREVMGATQVVLTDAVVRLPIDTVIDRRDRVQVTHRHGVALTDAPTYEIIGEPAQGPSALVLGLRLVTDGSDT